VEYLSLAEIAYQKIKATILKHEIVPGQRLSHEDLVLRLKISQTPIREALSRLAQEGYVTRLTNRGYRVSEMTAEEVEELFGLRSALEAYCIDEAIRRITPDGIKALEQSVKSSRKAIVANDPLVDRYIINKDFHVIVAEIAGNSAVARVLNDTCEKLVLKRRIEGVTHGGFAVLRHHQEIFQAIKRKDAKRAQELMRSHLQNVKTILLKQIEARTRTARAR
jgi:DNA-binding GntR family transcriptional regulator